MNFFQHQAQAKRQTRWLVVLFILAVLAIVIAVDLVLMVVFGMSNQESGAAGLFTAEAVASNAPALIGGSVGTAGVIGLASLFKTASLRDGGGKVARDLGGTLVNSDTRDPLRRRLRNVVEEIALASGVPVPEIYVLEQEAGINAFAAGFSPSDAAIAVTRGTLEKLNRDELQGVIAHEFSHVFNGDMRLNIKLMGVLFGILILALAGRKVLHSAHYVGRGKNNNGGAIIFVALALMIIGYIGLFFGRWIKSAVSRQREYLADASAVQFTRHPEGISGALKKIAVYSEGSHLDADAEEISHMLFGEARAASMLATHPPLLDRIRRIQPDFQEEELKVIGDRMRRERKREVEKEKRAAAAEEKRAPFDPRNIIDQIGNPDWDKLMMAAALAASIPEEIQSAAHSAEWAPEVLFLLLLDPDKQIREEQLLIIAREMGPDSERQVSNLLHHMPEVGADQRLALMEIVFPALKRRPPQYLTELMKTVQLLIKADGKVDLFEYVLAKLVQVYLWDAMNPRRAESSGSKSLSSRQKEIVQLFALLSHHGHSNPTAARAAFEHGLLALKIQSTEMPVIGDDWQDVMDRALQRLDELKPSAKEKLVTALLATITHDEQVTVEESELLRAVCASIHAPLPILS